MFEGKIKKRMSPVDDCAKSWSKGENGGRGGEGFVENDSFSYILTIILCWRISSTDGKSRGVFFAYALFIRVPTLFGNLEKSLCFGYLLVICGFLTINTELAKDRVEF